MGLFDALGISSSGLTAQRMRMDVTAENLANAQSVGYHRKDVVVREVAPQGGFGATLAGAMGPGSPAGSGVEVGSATAGGPAGSGVEVAAITTDQSAGRRVYDPGNPAADKQGYVRMPNVNPVTEMVDLIDASRAYESNVTAMQSAKQMFTKTLDLLR
jgi:flagellar basal-body rod protein FlgC